ncbi:hypothetical protein J6590_023109 [Homalodisca vitripennis]|nr:hypothetical protein J6590_023109 [Homalodisca vitripennis]
MNARGFFATCHSEYDGYRFIHWKLEATRPNAARIDENWRLCVVISVRVDYSMLSINHRHLLVHHQSKSMVHNKAQTAWSKKLQIKQKMTQFGDFLSVRQALIPSFLRSLQYRSRPLRRTAPPWFRSCFDFQCTFGHCLQEQCVCRD